METVTNKFSTPQGYSVVRPYLMVADIEKQIEFLKEVFDAIAIEEIKGDAGKIIHAEMLIGDSIIMIGQSTEDFKSLPGMNYIYVQDVDATFQKARAAAAETIVEPTVQFYGNKEGGFKDFHENIWWVSQFTQQISTAEIERMASDLKK